MNNEIIMDNEVEEITGELMRSSSKTGITKFIGFGLGLAVGGLAYGKVIKPYLEKRKAGKEIAALEKPEIDNSEDNDEA